jgi:hypothetical protein
MDLEINFCKDCHNLTFLHLNEEKELIHFCNLCNTSAKVQSEEHCIYQKSFSEIDISQLINNNKYINQDITLPTIVGNKSIQCPNDQCISIKEKKPSSVKYLKYHFDNMNYIYICNHCGQKWNNK